MYCPRPSHRAPVPCCPSRGLTALSSDAFACLFALFRRVRSVSCTILTWVPGLRPASCCTPLSVRCVSVPGSVSRMSFHLLISRLVSFLSSCGSRDLSSLHLLNSSFDLYAPMSRSVRTHDYSQLRYPRAAMCRLCRVLISLYLRWNVFSAHLAL